MAEKIQENTEVRRPVSILDWIEVDATCDVGSYGGFVFYREGTGTIDTDGEFIEEIVVD